MPSDEFAAHIVTVARLLWGEENRKLSNKRELRWGSHGSRSVIPARGVWRDNEADEGGGVLDLILRDAGGIKTPREAADWMRGKGIDIPEPARGGGSGQRRGLAEPAETNGRDEAPPWEPEDESSTQTVPYGGGRVDGFHEARSWDYVTDKGDVLFQVVRFEADDGSGEKTYRQRRKEGDRWVWSTKGIEKVPYRLPELRQAIADGATVFIPEGEKCVDRLIDEGFASTTNAGGAGKWDDGLARFFADADVVILPDNDPQAKKKDGTLLVHEDGKPKHTGWDHGMQIAKSLHGVARSVRWLALGGRPDSPGAGPGLAPKGDVFDWFTAPHTAEDFSALVAKAETWTPEFDWRSKFFAIPWHELDKPGPEHEWLIKGWLTRRDRSMLVGPSQSGKSFLALAAAMSVATGAEFFGHRVRQGLVVYQAGEGRLGFKKRLRAYREHYKIPADQKLPFVLLPKRIDLFASDDHTNQLIEEISHWQRVYAPVILELVVIDTYSAATPGANENASEDVSRVLLRCDRIAGALGCHVLIVHHMNAAGTKPRGHTSVFADLDNVISCQLREGLSDDGEDKGTDTVTGRPIRHRRPIREAKITKQKDGADGEVQRFVLKRIVLGRDADGDDVSSCVVVPPFQAGEQMEPQRELSISLTAQAQIFYRAVNVALDEHGEPAPPSLGLPVGVRVVEWKHVRDAFGRMSFEEEGDGSEKERKRHVEAVRKALQRHGEKLLADGIIMRERPYVWLTGKRVRGYRPRLVGTAAAATPAPEPPRPAVPGFDQDLEGDLPF